MGGKLWKKIFIYPLEYLNMKRVIWNHNHTGYYEKMLPYAPVRCRTATVRNETKRNEALIESVNGPYGPTRDNCVQPRHLVTQVRQMEFNCICIRNRASKVRWDKN